MLSRNLTEPFLEVILRWSLRTVANGMDRRALKLRALEWLIGSLVKTSLLSPCTTAALRPYVLLSFAQGLRPQRHFPHLSGPNYVLSSFCSDFLVLTQ